MAEYWEMSTGDVLRGSDSILVIWWDNEEAKYVKIMCCVF